MKFPMLSKSRIIAGLQCPLRLWNQVYSPELAGDLSITTQGIFDTGHEVGRLATTLYPGGVLIEEDHLHHQEGVQSTRKYLQDASISSIYEAAFIHDGVRVRTDILERVDEEKWNLIEVKSSTSIKDVHISDLALQYYVVQGSGIEINEVRLLYLNNQYVFDGLYLDLDQLFNIEDLTAEILAIQGEIPSTIANMKEILKQTNSPEINPSRHCKKPYECEFWGYCRAKAPEFWVMGLSGISQRKLDELAAIGIDDISQIPKHFFLSNLQERIRDCVVNGVEYLDPRLKHELLDVEYPIHFLDFETISPAIPRFVSTRPYHTVPFQWSDHVLYENGILDHRDYLCEKDKDPREDFIKTLVKILSDRGTIFVYTMYERDVLNSLIDGFPQYQQALLSIICRFKDLCALISQYFYHPLFHGSFSLKSTLPALVPSMNYGNLNIQDGMAASFEYLRMLEPQTPKNEKEKIKKNLLIYCAHDTMGMVKIREVLLERF